MDAQAWPADQVAPACGSQLGGGRSGFLGVAIVAALAIAREGAETVIFLYGMSQEGGIGTMLIGAAVGIAAGCPHGMAGGAQAGKAEHRAAAAPVVDPATGSRLGTARFGHRPHDRCRLVTQPGRPVWDISGFVDDTTSSGKAAGRHVGLPRVRR